MANQREQGYRERTLKLFPWVCGHWTCEFVGENLQQLTVPGAITDRGGGNALCFATHNPFAALNGPLKK